MERKDSKVEKIGKNAQVSSLEYDPLDAFAPRSIALECINGQVQIRVEKDIPFIQVRGKRHYVQEVC